MTDHSISSCRTLTTIEQTNLRTQLYTQLNITTNQSDDEDDINDAENILDYALDMINDGDNVGHVMEELKYMEMKVCNEETVNKLGSIMTSFIRDLDKPDTEEEKGGDAKNKTTTKNEEEHGGSTRSNDQQQTMNGSSSTNNKSLVDTTATTSPPSTSTTSSNNNNNPPPSPSNNNNHTTNTPRPPSSSSSSNDNKLVVDFSAKAYSKKKSLELKSTFSQKQRHVSEIIKLMNDKGVGGIDLKGVNVEAFIHPSIKKVTENDGGEFMGMLAKALEEQPLQTGQSGGGGEEEGNGGGEDESRMEGGDDNSEIATAGRGSGTGRRSSGGVGYGTNDSSQEGGESNPYVVPHTASGKSTETYLERNYKSSRGVTRSMTEPTTPNDTADQVADVYESPHNMLLTDDDGNNVMEYQDRLNSQAYHMNATKNASFRKMGAPLSNEEAEQIELDEVVKDMANKQKNVKQLKNEKVFVPEKDEETLEYERRLQSRLDQNKEGRPNILPPSSPSKNNNGTETANNSTPEVAAACEISTESNRQASRTSSKNNAKIVSSTNDDDYLERKARQVDMEKNEVGDGAVAQDELYEDGVDSGVGKEVHPEEEDLNITDGAVLLDPTDVDKDEEDDTTKAILDQEENEEETTTNDDNMAKEEEGETEVVDEEEGMEVELETANEVAKEDQTMNGQQPQQQRQELGIDPAELQPDPVKDGCCTCNCVIS